TNLSENLFENVELGAGCGESELPILGDRAAGRCELHQTSRLHEVRGSDEYVTIFKHDHQLIFHLTIELELRRSERCFTHLIHLRWKLCEHLLLEHSSEAWHDDLVELTTCVWSNADDVERRHMVPRHESVAIEKLRPRGEVLWCETVHQ